MTNKPLGKFALKVQGRLKHAKRNKRMDEGTAVKVVPHASKPLPGPIGPHHKSLKHFDFLVNVDHSF